MGKIYTRTLKSFHSDHELYEWLDEILLKQISDSVWSEIERLYWRAHSHEYVEGHMIFSDTDYAVHIIETDDNKNIITVELIVKSNDIDDLPRLTLEE